MENTHRFLLNALEIFEEVALGKEKVSIQDLADRRDLSYASCYRIIQTFIEKGWLERDENGVYRSCPGLLIKVDLAHEQRHLISIMDDTLHRLIERTGLAAKMTMRQGHESATFYTLSSPRPNGIFSKQGTHFHLAGGSSGACLLSDLSDKEIRKILQSAPDHYWRHQSKEQVLARIEEVRKANVTFDHGTFSPHFHAASTPLRRANGRVVAAVTVLGFPSDFGSAQCNQYRRELLEVAKHYADSSSGAEASEPVAARRRPA